MFRKNKKKTNWIHINFWFNFGDNRGNVWGLSNEDVVKFRRFLLIIDNRLRNFISRRFYLFEPNPNCFFAMELKNRDDLVIVNKIVDSIIKDYIDSYKFISKTSISINSNDNDNGDGLLIMLDAATTFNLIHNDNSLAHIIHCISNNSFLNNSAEHNFYKEMSLVYAV